MPRPGRALLRLFAWIPMSRSFMLVLVATAAVACAPKEQQGAQASADSTASPNAFTDSAAARDSVGPMPGDSVSVDLSTLESKAIKAGPEKRAAGEIIGRDSAFGPTFTVDSTGKVTPIVPPRKKP